MEILPQNTHFGQIFEYQLQNHMGLRAKIFRDWSFRHYLQTKKVWEVIVSCPAWFDMELPVTLIVNNVKNTYVSGFFQALCYITVFVFQIEFVKGWTSFLMPKTWNQQGVRRGSKALVSSVYFGFENVLL